MKQKYAVSMDVRVPVVVLVTAKNADEAIELGTDLLRKDSGSWLYEAAEWLYDTAEANIETEAHDG
jgi:hypothetical protein